MVLVALGGTRTWDLGCEESVAYPSHWCCVLECVCECDFRPKRILSKWMGWWKMRSGASRIGRSSWSSPKRNLLVGAVTAWGRVVTCPERVGSILSGEIVVGNLIDQACSCFELFETFLIFFVFLLLLVFLCGEILIRRCWGVSEERLNLKLEREMAQQRVALANERAQEQLRQVSSTLDGGGSGIDSLILFRENSKQMCTL